MAAAPAAAAEARLCCAGSCACLALITCMPEAQCSALLARHGGSLETALEAYYDGEAAGAGGTTPGVAAAAAEEEVLEEEEEEEEDTASTEGGATAAAVPSAAGDDVRGDSGRRPRREMKRSFTEFLGDMACPPSADGRTRLKRTPTVLQAPALSFPELSWRPGPRCNAPPTTHRIMIIRPRRSSSHELVGNAFLRPVK